LRFALGNSLNVAAIRALELAGGPEALQRAMQRAGVTTLHHPTEYYGLGLTLGNGEVRLLELANAYATLARLGVYRPFRMLQESAGALEAGGRVFDENACLALAGMLSDNAARAASFGTGSWLSFDFPVACKTGTSSDYRDNWAMGYTPEFTVGVWVGNADGSKMRGITGVTGAAPVMHQVFEHLRKTRGLSWFGGSPLAEYDIDPLTGRLAPAGRPAVREKCRHAPEAARAEDYDAQGRNVLPAEYAEWIAGSQNNLGERVVCTQGAGELRILAPGPGSSYFLDGDLPASAQWIALRAAGRGELEWSSPTLAVRREGGVFRAEMREGRHTLLAREAETGREVKTWIEVKRW
jgi:penicillin-binding protein 1C